MPDTLEHEAEQLSALADGELDPNGVARTCAKWQARGPAHATWHAYHLIGDVLRSEDLAGLPRRDYVCLDTLREKLAREPVIFAPGTSVRSSAAVGWARKPWAALSAVAAGFGAVAVVLIVLREPAGDSEFRAEKSAGPGASAVAANYSSAASRPGSAPQALFADGRLVRDARLDRYLDAHKQFSGVSALGVPSTFLRGETSDASNR